MLYANWLKPTGTDSPFEIEINQVLGAVQLLSELS